MIGIKKLTIRWAVSVVVIAVSFVCTFALAAKAEAAVYKCTDANNNVSYNQLPCPVEEKAETMLSVKSKTNAALDCRIANNFARQIASRMRSGESSGNVFDSYGGIDATSSTAVGIISYVYSHKGNVDTGPQRITALSAARCSAGAYGPVNCDDFPHNFIADFGGCEQAGMKKTMESSSTAPSDQTTRSVKEEAKQALSSDTSETKISKLDDCEQDLQAQLKVLLEQMRTAQSDNKQNQLETQREQLRVKHANC